MVTRARQSTMIMETELAFPFIEDSTRGKSWKIKLFPKPVGRIAKTSYIDLIFYAIHLICSSRRHSTWGKSFDVLSITDLNTASLVERSLIPAILHISSASVMFECWQNLSKSTNQRVYQILVYRKDLLLSLSTRVLSLLLTELFLSFGAPFFALCPN